MLCHVPRQVSLLRVGLTADVADLRLEMFRRRVTRDVLLEPCLVREALVAGVAAVRPVGHVAARVALQVGELRERLRAAVVSTPVRLLARVRANVLLEVAELREPAVAELAPVRFDAEVDARVLRQVRRVGEALAARRARQRFGTVAGDGLTVTVDEMDVVIQTGFIVENLLTYCTSKSTIHARKRYRSLHVNIGWLLLLMMMMMERWLRFWQ